MGTVDRPELADFLRRRRAVLQPEDVGLHPGPRRRTPGLRREDVASLAGMSTDYYARLEQGRGPQPSESMLAAISRGLRLSQDERDHLFRLAGHTAPARDGRSGHVSPALLHVLDRLDTPAQVVDDLGRTHAQNPMAVALNGDHAALTGHARSICFRWFAGPEERAGYPEEDHDHHARVFVGGLRAAAARTPDDPEVRDLVADLRRRSPEFATLWDEHDVSVRMDAAKRKIHPAVGAITLNCQRLACEGDGQFLLVYTAVPGSEDREKLDLLRVVGDQRFAPTG
jgi:transcriptional regulator with XRE-family HTH domain